MVTLKKLSLLGTLVLAMPQVSFAYPQPTNVAQAFVEHARNLKDSLATRIQKIRKGSEAYVPRLRPVPTALAGAALVGTMALIIVARSLNQAHQATKPKYYVSEEQRMPDTIGRTDRKDRPTSASLPNLTRLAENKDTPPTTDPLSTFQITGQLNPDTEVTANSKEGAEQKLRMLEERMRTLEIQWKEEKDPNKKNALRSEIEVFNATLERNALNDIRAEHGELHTRKGFGKKRPRIGNAFEKRFPADEGR